MDATNTHRRVVFMKSAQTGGTEVANNIVGYFTSQDPSPMLIIQPTLDMAQTWSKDRLQPMLRDTPILKGLVAHRRAKDSENTILHKRFPGGHLTVAGANSSASLASRPVRITIFDECDRFPVSAGNEGDPISLGLKRSTTFWNRFSLEISTPTVKGASRIEQSYEGSTMDRFYVPCPHCGEFQTLKWGGKDAKFGVKWPENEPNKAYYVCDAKGCQIFDRDKSRMLKRGEWRSQYPDRLAKGFHINELYSPWVTFGEIAAAFMQAKDYPDTLKTWVNTALGETWEEEGDTFEPHTLYMRREHYASEVPEGVNALTAFVDVQDDRVEFEVQGHGAGEEVWTIDYVILYGDPSKSTLWDVLGSKLKRQYVDADDVLQDIKLVGIDSGGHYTDEVYAFSRKHGVHWVIPTKGSNQRNQPIAKMPRTKTAKGVYLTTLGTDTCKELIYRRYAITDPGPGYCHWPIKDWCDETYFEQATAEKRMLRFTHGVPYYQWEAQKRRNEVLDCRVGNLAMIRILQQYRGIRLEQKVNGTAKRNHPIQIQAERHPSYQRRRL